MKTRRWGFTLIELLMVVIVISILALMLFPVIERVQERGRAVKCANHLRQLYTATMSYISNTGGYLPQSASARFWGRTNNGVPWQHHSWSNGWVASHPMNTVNMKAYWWAATNATDGNLGLYCITNGTIFPYLGDRGDESVYVCPSMLLSARRTFPGSDPRSIMTRSYGMNDEVNGQRYHDIDGVSRRILFADQGFANLGRVRCLSNTGSATNDPDPDITSPATYYRQRYDRGIDGSIENGLEFIGEVHGRRPGQNTGMANAIFLDGHVEMMVYTNTDSVLTGAWEYGRRVP